MRSSKRLVLFTAFCVSISSQIWCEADSATDPAFLIGISLEELIGRNGTPRSVYAVRGFEEWQDDVVFVYEEGDFYILKDRVWQIRLDSAYMVNSGDHQDIVHQRFTNIISVGRDYTVIALDGQNWPLAMRFNFDLTGKVAAIFIYRSDI